MPILTLGRFGSLTENVIWCLFIKRLRPWILCESWSGVTVCIWETRRCKAFLLRWFATY